MLTNTEAEEAAAERSIVLILGQLPPGCLSLSHTAAPTTATEMGTHDQTLLWGDWYYNKLNLEKVMVLLLDAFLLILFEFVHFNFYQLF